MNKKQKKLCNCSDENLIPVAISEDNRIGIYKCSECGREYWGLFYKIEEK